MRVTFPQNVATFFTLVQTAMDGSDGDRVAVPEEDDYRGEKNDLFTSRTTEASGCACNDDRPIVSPKK